MATRKIADIGKTKIGRWTVVELADEPGITKWLCRCDCGTTRNVAQHLLISGGSASCGCANKEATAQRKLTHGGYGTRTYRIWAGMIQRCENPNKEGYANYGGRGISVCPEWRASFEAFLSDMGEAPDAYSLDRIDNDGDYTKDNCRWATSKEQAFNTRQTVLFEGKSMEEWSQITGIKVTTLRARMQRKGTIHTRNPKAIPMKSGTEDQTS